MHSGIMNWAHHHATINGIHMHGMGQTEAPADPAAYDIDHITADLIGLLDYLADVA